MAKTPRKRNAVDAAFWAAVSSYGQSPKFKTPGRLWDACCEYFEWVRNNPLYTVELVKYQGRATQVRVPKTRAMQLSALCMYIGLNQQEWLKLKARKRFMRICEDAEIVIYNQKFTAAAADTLNANVIIRDLGLADRKDVDHGIKDSLAAFLESIDSADVGLPNVDADD